jgi:hypothetical protein
MLCIFHNNTERIAFFNFLCLFTWNFFYYSDGGVSLINKIHQNQEIYGTITRTLKIQEKYEKLKLHKALKFPQFKLRLRRTKILIKLKHQN